MENASKALMMAGSVFLAIMVISLLVFMYSQVTNIKDIDQDQERAEKIAEFNQEFESYNRRDLYGAQIGSLVNRMMDNNEKYRRADEPNYEMNLKLKFTVYESGSYFCKNKAGTTYNTLDSVHRLLQNASVDNETEFKRKIFKCTGIEYNEETGRVKQMSFEEVDPTNPTYQIKKK